MSELEWYAYLIFFAAGAMAGIINVLAGNGSAITLSTLILFGISPTIANATNRVGVFVLAVTVLFSIRKSPSTVGLFKRNAWLSIPALVGSGIGAYGATLVSDKMLEYVAIGALALILLSMLLQPGKWGREDRGLRGANKWLTGFSILFAGLYAGFIQMGVGIILLASLVLLSKFSFRQANLIKQILVFGLASVPLAVFIFNDMIHWGAGLALAAGQATTGWAVARYALQNPKAQIWIRRLVVVIIIVALLGLLDVHEYLF